MLKHYLNRKAFTLIEVMVAVMIVSVVIAALIKMQGNTTQKFLGIKKMIQTNQYSSFLLSLDGKYGFEKSHINMNRLVEEFDIEDDLRRRFKAIDVKLNYEKLSTIDMSDYDESEQKTLIFEIGRTTLKTEEFTDSLIRVKIQ